MIAIYAYQRSDDAEKESIDNQINICLHKCTGEYIPFIDREVSGKKNDRPSYNQLIKAIKRGEIDKLIVYKLGVIVHSLTDFSHLWDILKENNTEFCSVNDNFDTSTYLGRRIIDVITAFAQIERDTIAKRIRDNYRQRAKRGIYPGGPAPYGFNIGHTLCDGKSVSILTPNDKIDIVKTIFEIYAQGNISLGKLASYLHEQGISGINRSGWDNVSISRILHNPAYVRADLDIYNYYKQKGIIIYNKPEEFTGKTGCWLLGKRSHAQDSSTGGELLVIACHQGVIDSETFIKCQQRLDSNKRLNNNGNRAYTWLGGLVKCGYCGYSMQAVSANGGRYVYLICTGKTNFKVCTTKFRSPHVDKIEKVISEKIDERLKIIKSVNPPKKPDKKQFETLKHNLELINAKIPKLVNALAESNEISAGYINQKIAELDNQKNKISEDIKNMLERKSSIDIPDSSFSSLSFEQKKALAKLLIKKVSITSDNVDIEWSEI
jgi:site-specific DNA recombinase